MHLNYNFTKRIAHNHNKKYSNRGTKSMKKIRLTSIVLFLVLILSSIPIFSATAGVWPDITGTDHEWYAYAFENGSLIYDPADESPASTDIISVTGLHPSIFISSDGSNVFFRMRLRGDPRQPPRYSSFYWIVEIAAEDTNGNFVHTATVGLQGGNPSNIYIAPSYGNNLTNVYSNVTTLSTDFVRVMPTNDGYSHYYLDFQVPIASINQVSGQYGNPIITGTTPVKFFYGTSTNPVHIGKDFMTGSAVNFDNLAYVVLDDIQEYLAPELSVDKIGPASVSAGEQIQYQLIVKNLGPGNATNVVISDYMPSDIINAEYSLNNGNSWQPWSGTRTLPLFLADPGINNILI